MIDLSSALSEATHNILTWRNRYDFKKYPHMVVVNMMYRAYSMDRLFDLFLNGNLPSYSNFNESVIAMERKYGEIALQIQPYLMNWLQTNPNDNIGTLCFNNFDNLASKAEVSAESKEELEFSYIFELLCDKSVLYWIAMVISGVSKMNAIAKMTNAFIEPIPNITYTIAKQIFQQLLVGRYMHEHYTPIL